MGYTLHDSQVHYTWNRDIPSVIEVEPGSDIEIACQNSGGTQVSPQTQADDLLQFDFSKLNPVTGPIFVKGAEPGDVIQVDIREMTIPKWGWSAIIPHFGLLSEEYPMPYMHHWDLTGHAATFRNVEVPLHPFIGTIGVAPEAAGDYSVIAPLNSGGNMDTRQIGQGSTLWLPVFKEGAMLSLGDCHAAQGDGEVCGTAIEISAQVALRIQLIKQRPLESPAMAMTPDSQRTGAYFATTGIGPDLFAGAQSAVRQMVKELMRHGYSREDAYVLCSILGDLKISEIVDQPHWVVSFHMPMHTVSFRA